MGSPERDYRLAGGANWRSDVLGKDPHNVQIKNNIDDHRDTQQSQSNQRHQVYLGADPINAGDAVIIVRQECSSSKVVSKNNQALHCGPVVVGRGAVVEPLKERGHDSLVRFNPGVELKEGDVVKKAK